jgi:hypothetical protein
MPRTRLVVHVAEPFDFARGNAGVGDLHGWTAQAAPAYSDWVVHLDAPARIGDDEFDKVKITSRYAGESVSKVLEGFGYTAINIAWPRLDETGRTFWHYGLVGSVLLEAEER